MLRKYKEKKQIVVILFMIMSISWTKFELWWFVCRIFGQVENKASINVLNDDEGCFQYVITVVVNHEKII